MFLQPEHIEGSENSCTEDMVPLVSHRLPQVFCGALGASSDGGRSRTCSQGHALGTAPFLPSDARRWARAELPDRGRLRTTGSHSWVGAGGYGGQEPPCSPRSAWRSQCSVYVVTGKTDVTRSPWKPAWARPGRLSVCLEERSPAEQWGASGRGWSLPLWPRGTSCSHGRDFISSMSSFELIRGQRGATWKAWGAAG